MHRGWARLLLDRARGIIAHGPAHRGANVAAMPTDEGDQRGGEERQERRASKMKLTARIHQVKTTILHRALRSRQRLKGCGLLWQSCGAQNVTTIQWVPRIDFSKNRENEWTRKILLLILKYI